ncbi:MAG: VCBS repeat-containing protein [Candidatus Adiutrix sp.]|jgi:hypothetical protein|nr:VCBS repeat-containing protein [Candidatus Adiutrix sp.]
MKNFLKQFFAPTALGLFCLAALTGPPADALADDGQTNKRHPSYNLIGRDAPPDSPLNPNFVVADESRLSERGFWRSSYIPESLVGLAVEDIDRDGKNELVYASEKNIYVGRVNGGKLNQLASWSAERTERIVSIDALDLTGDGRMEIIASMQNDKATAAGVILGFDGKTLTPVSGRLPWYLRVVGAPGGRFLAGQKPASSHNEFYSGKVVRLSFDGKTVKAAGAVNVPNFVNVFNFTIGVLGSNRTQMVAAVKYPSEHIFLFEGGSDRAWETREEYGGTMNHLQPFVSAEDAQHARKEYLPTRLIIADIDLDGQNELIAAKNDRGGVNFMSNLRAFSSGAVQVFKYANLALTPSFRTRALPGPAVDLQLADLDNNGSMDLVAAVVVEQKSGMLKDGRSIIIAYELGVSNQP